WLDARFTFADALWLVQARIGFGKLIVAVNGPTAFVPLPPVPLKVNAPPEVGMDPAGSWIKYSPGNCAIFVSVTVPEGPLTVTLPASRPTSCDALPPLTLSLSQQV